MNPTRTFFFALPLRTRPIGKTTQGKRPCQNSYTSRHRDTPNVPPIAPGAESLGSRYRACGLRLLLALLASAPFSGAGTEAAAAESYAESVVERTLDNGLEVLLLEDHKAPVAVVQVWYRVGSRNETPGRTGLSHMLEHMLFKGTTRFGDGEYSRLISRNGGDENAFTSDDATTYFAKLASDRLDIELELEADRMRNLILTEERFAPERNVVAEERRLRVDDDPIAFMMETLSAHAFLEHPYRQPIIGWAGDIQSWTLEDLRTHYDRYYQPNNAVLVVVGDFDAATLGRRIDTLFGSIPRGPDAPAVSIREETPRGARRIEVRRQAQLPFIVIAWQVPNFIHPDGPALDVLSTVLAGGKSSRLWEKLVREERLALDVGAGFSTTSIDNKLFTVSGQPQPGIAPEKLEAALLDQIAAVAKEGVKTDEVSRAKAQIEAAAIFAQDSMFYRAMLLGSWEMTGDWRRIDTYLPAIRKVTAADLKRVALEWLGTPNRAVGVLIPESAGTATPARKAS